MEEKISFSSRYPLVAQQPEPLEPSAPIPSPGKAPVASFSGTPVSGTVPAEILFTDLSVRWPTSWYWDFGDGSISPIQHPRHTYTLGGTYTVTLTATNQYGHDSTSKRYLFSQAVPPSLSIEATDADKLEGTGGGVTEFTFTVTRSGDTSGTSSVAWAVTGTGDHPADANDFQDSTLPSGTLEFAADETEKVITVYVNADGDVEADEQFTVTLSEPVDATIEVDSAVGIIRNDDTSGGVCELTYYEGWYDLEDPPWILGWQVNVDGTLFADYLPYYSGDVEGFAERLEYLDDIDVAGGPVTCYVILHQEAYSSLTISIYTMSFGEYYDHYFEGVSNSSQFHFNLENLDSELIGCLLHAQSLENDPDLTDNRVWIECFQIIQRDWAAENEEAGVLYF